MSESPTSDVVKIEKDTKFYWRRVWDLWAFTRVIDMMKKAHSFLQNKKSIHEKLTALAELTDEEVNGILMAIKEIWLTSKSSRETVERLQFLFSPKDSES